MTATIWPSSCQTRSKSEAISLRRSAAFGSTSQKRAKSRRIASARSIWGSSGGPIRSSSSAIA
ncbi:MAG TPA: hypothetical protein VGH58_02330 [Solirubrobacterales bacterium]